MEAGSASACSPWITSSGPPSPPSRSGMSASGAMPRLMGMRSAGMRRAEMPPPTAATHATNRPPTTPPGSRGRNLSRGWGGVSFCVPVVWWRHPSQRRRPAGAGSLRTGGSQAGEGQDGFARVKLSPDKSRRTARTTARLVDPWPADRLGRARAGPRRPGNLSGTDRRAARDRHPQPMTAFHATVRTAREKSGFKAGLRRREKSGLERG
jgi:hypothetical protein